MQLEERPTDGRETAGTPRTWVLNAWYAAAWSENVAPGAMLARTILNEPIVLFRQPDGKLVAFADSCPHRFAPLSLGKVLPNGNLQCGYHGLEFDARGACALNPHGDGTIGAELKVRSYPICERYGVAWIWPGSNEPDEGKIADFSMFENVPELYRSSHDYIHVDAPYTMLQDNLMDASHVPFVHVGTLVTSTQKDDEPEALLEQNGDQVAITRKFSNKPVMAIIDMQYRSNGRPADTWNTIRWDPPGSILVFSSANDHGADRSTGTGYNGMHLLTPETETTAHYHFWAARWNPRDPDVESSLKIQEVLNVVRRRAFEEQDVPIIVAQARNRQRLGLSHRPSMLFTDAAAVRVQRILDGLIAAEEKG
jgi:phenylpropionate dioxygenase-like ring-hydroxylating dioxygenase large terminal subunit